MILSIVRRNALKMIIIIFCLLFFFGLCFSYFQVRHYLFLSPHQFIQKEKFITPKKSASCHHLKIIGISCHDVVDSVITAGRSVPNSVAMNGLKTFGLRPKLTVKFLMSKSRANAHSKITFKSTTLSLNLISQSQSPTAVSKKDCQLMNPKEKHSYKETKQTLEQFKKQIDYDLKYERERPNWYEPELSLKMYNENGTYWATKRATLTNEMSNSFSDEEREELISKETNLFLTRHEDNSEKMIRFQEDTVSNRKSESFHDVLNEYEFVFYPCTFFLKENISHSELKLEVFIIENDNDDSDGLHQEPNDVFHWNTYDQYNNEENKRQIDKKLKQMIDEGLHFDSPTQYLWDYLQ